MSLHYGFIITHVIERNVISNSVV